MAGDLNGDGNVDGNDSALLAAALGSTAGGANYSLAADINGDGKVDQQDAVILASDYGFHATTAAVPTAPPARPVFDLDVNSDTAPVGDGMTTDATVTLVGQTDPNLTVTLQQTGAVTKSNPNGLFVFFDVPLADGANAFTAVATNAGGVSSQFTKIITRTQPGLSLTPPVISAHLAERHRPSRRSTTSRRTTRSPAASPRRTRSRRSRRRSISRAWPTCSARFRARRSRSRRRSWPRSTAAPLADGKHTLTLIAKDSNGNLSQPVTVSFILTTTPPAPVTPQLLASSDTGISSSDGITRSTTPTFKVDAPTGSIVRLYADGVQVGQATANNGPVFITTTALAAGTHQMTATAEDVAGNVERGGGARNACDRHHAAGRADAWAWTPRRRARPGRPPQTNKEIVNLTGKTDAGAFVALYRQSDPNTPIRTTQADSSGNFTFNNVALAAGTQAFIVVASDVAGNSSQLTQTITTTASDTSAPVITAALANDTGISSTDGITSDPTITGVVDDPSGVASFQVALDGGTMVDVSASLERRGLHAHGGGPGDD